MKKVYYNNIRILLMIRILFFLVYCSNIKEKSIIPRKLDNNNPPPPPFRIDDLEEEKEYLENEYRKKLEENNLLKQQIEKQKTYIKVLLTSCIIMFSIIVFISIKTIIKCKKNKQFKNAEKGNNINKKKELNNIYISEKNIENNNIISSLNSNDSIEKSNYNLLNSDKNINILNNNNISDSKKEDNLNNNNNVVSDENNFDAPKIANFSNIIINDENKTLTNNPDIFIPSKMDRILYKPYSNEEINK